MTDIDDKWISVSGDSVRFDDDYLRAVSDRAPASDPVAITNVLRHPAKRLSGRKSLVALVVILVAASVTFSVHRIDALYRRGQQITPGMPEKRVLEILGTPRLSLPRAAPASGKVSVWIDWFWQVDVTFDGESRVEKLGFMHANSPIRRTQTNLESYFE